MLRMTELALCSPTDRFPKLSTLLRYSSPSAGLGYSTNGGTLSMAGSFRTKIGRALERSRRHSQSRSWNVCLWYGWKCLSLGKLRRSVFQRNRGSLNKAGILSFFRKQPAGACHENPYNIEGTSRKEWCGVRPQDAFIEFGP